MAKTWDAGWNAGIWTGVCTSAVIFLAILLLINSNSPENIFEGIDIDKDKLVKEYIVEWYPEYEGCDIIYYKDIYVGDESASIWGHDGARVYCNGIDDRDGLRVGDKDDDYEVVYFEDITIQEILIQKLESEGIGVKKK